MLPQSLPGTTEFFLPLKLHYRSLLEMDTLLGQILPLDQKLVLLPTKTGGAPRPDLLHHSAVHVTSVKGLLERETSHHVAWGHSGRTGWRGPIQSIKCKPSSYTSALQNLAFLPGRFPWTGDPLCLTLQSKQNLKVTQVTPCRKE